MSTRSFRTTLAALALVATAACAPDQSPPDTAVRPTVVSPVDAVPITVAVPSAASPATPKRTPKPSSGTCLGAVVHTVDASADAPPWRPVCIAVGGVVRVEWLGPGELTVTPASRASCAYAGGVHMCRLIGTGPARFGTATRRLDVTVAAAASPPKPSPACDQPGTIRTLDAGDGGPPWPAVCMRIGSKLRVEHLGPWGFEAAPAGIMSCWYEAAVRECTFTRPGTVTITISRPDVEPRRLIIVAIS
ncbi:hypothetical protein F4553_007426 [Allocatelliglobosispora scoriae]|uniref:Ig-like domain-containing protein n=1 Tax=Allocatelliglobosispora scoriae TaxID=643052 RepID=A0A841C4K6_9ACTN|nr:hypothetical protein [Allocatelliglobosispora scoriae]MBB5873992.1 hypothetical protein [Allocatelliglobosispora scoriae]